MGQMDDNLIILVAERNLSLIDAYRTLSYQGAFTGGDGLVNRRERREGPEKGASSPSTLPPHAKHTLGPRSQLLSELYVLSGQSEPGVFPHTKI